MYMKIKGGTGGLSVHGSQRRNGRLKCTWKSKEEWEVEMYMEVKGGTGG